MRFVTYAEDDGPRVGVLHGHDIHALPAGVALVDLLGDDGERLAEAGARALADPQRIRPSGEVRLCAPIPTPPTVRDFMTFEQHFAGVLLMFSPDATIPRQWYQAPVFYFTNPYAVIGPDDPVPIPPGCTLFDFELEVAAVIGRAGRDVAPEDAERYIAGYTILNDWSARDLQFDEMQVRLGPVKGKDTVTTLGPALVTPDELAERRSGPSFDLAMTAAVNGVTVGEDRLSSMHFSFGEMIAQASRGTEIRPGDVLGSGTCGGGCLAELWGRRGRDAHPPLRAGDTVTVSVDRLGTLTSHITPYGDR
jgi:2-keto-4-pentenoate hydratase/2-oxohepta-3-ene-1,7-dioic acid hydratase in catechol pathway